MAAQQMKKFFRSRRVAHKTTALPAEHSPAKKSYGLSESQKLAKLIAGEINGLCPYERKAVEYIKGDNIKKARKFLKIRLGSLVRAEKKFDILMKQYR